MSAVVFAFSARKSVPRPWQNDELAEFYRVIDMLGRSGLGVVPDMGVSDEGDPWFAFCRSDTGEVVVHCARIDGVCVATSIATSEVFRGTSIRDVISAIIRCRQFALATMPSAESRLYLHPTVVLTAFIVAALLFSHQASAHTAHAGGSGTAPDVPVTLTKILAALRGMVGESVAPIVTSVPGADQAQASAPEPEPFPLAVLLSAAMTLIAPVLRGSEGLLDWDAPTALLSNPTNLSDPSLIGALPLIESLSQNSAFFQTIDQFSAAAATAPLPPKLADFTGGSGNLVIPASDLPFSGQADGATSTLAPASETSTTGFVIHAPPAPFHNAAPIASTNADSSSTTIVQPAVPVHTVDLTEITSIALAVFFGDAFTTASATTAIVPSPNAPMPTVDPSSPGDNSSAHGGDASSNSATMSSPATESSATVTDPSNPGVNSSSHATDSPPATTDSSSPATDSSPPPVDSSPSTANSSPAPVNSAPAATVDTSSPPADTTTNSASTSSADASLAPTLPTNFAVDSVTVPSTIVMDANPTLAIEQLMVYAATTPAITAPLTVSATLATELHAAEGGSTQPLELIVFDSSAVKLPFFEFAPGIYFVDDQDLGMSASQAAPSQLVTVDLAAGGTMQLLGVVSTAHLAF